MKSWFSLSFLTRSGYRGGGGGYGGGGGGETY
jgi:hypothetical protein